MENFSFDRDISICTYLYSPQRLTLRITSLQEKITLLHRQLRLTPENIRIETSIKIYSEELQKLQSRYSELLQNQSVKP
jgi:hypothetical protein